MVTPVADYVLVQVIKRKSSDVVITTSDISDTEQQGKVLAISKYIDDKYIETDTVHASTLIGLNSFKDLSVGDIVYFQKHADADTPEDLKKEDLLLIKFNRIMAIKEKK